MSSVSHLSVYTSHSNKPIQGWEELCQRVLLAVFGSAFLSPRVPEAIGAARQTAVNYFSLSRFSAMVAGSISDRAYLCSGVRQ